MIGNKDELVRQLYEEITFWQTYIQYRQQQQDLPVPPRAYEALIMAEQNLSSHLNMTLENKEKSKLAIH